MAKDRVMPPPDYTSVEAYALRALSRGEATAEQQKLCLHIIANKICEVGEDKFDRDPYVHAYHAGMAAVPKKIAKLILRETIERIENYEKKRNMLRQGRVD